MKTLKGKITLVYIFLGIIIAVVGISSVINFYGLSKSINGLMRNNYKSINCVEHMRSAIEDQNIALLNYIYSDNKNSINKFYEAEGTFYKWYNVELNNITEQGEQKLVDAVNVSYIKYQSLIPEIQKIKDSSGVDAAAKFYNTNVVNSYVNMRTVLNNLTKINEKEMFLGRDDVTHSAKQSMYVIMILSIVAILLGFIISSFFTNKFFKPLYKLKENMKAIKEGDMKQEILIFSNDEIGDLALEFNKMTNRLQRFEQSTKGKLLEEKNRSLAIVKSISDPLIVLDIEYKVILLNHACENFFNIQEKDALNKHFLEVIRNSDVYNHILQAEVAIEEKHRPKIISVEAGGKEFYFDTIVTKIKDKESSMKGLVVLFQNVTKLKKLEKTKTDFVATISHELKTPLTSIMMGTSLIKNGGLGKLSDKQNEVVRTIEEDTERLAALVSDIIQLSKIESDRAIFHYEPCSIFEIAENCIKVFAEQASIKEINLYSEVEEGLPKILADYEKISWVINNLISNAIKSTNAGDYITIGASIENKMMYVSVKDSGIGIAEEYREKIFEKFIKVESYNIEAKGTGLGLAIAKEIVETHKGAIWCESKIDEGTVFIFTLPVID